MVLQDSRVANRLLAKVAVILLAAAMALRPTASLAPAPRRVHRRSLDQKRPAREQKGDSTEAEEPNLNSLFWGMDSETINRVTGGATDAGTLEETEAERFDPGTEDAGVYDGVFCNDDRKVILFDGMCNFCSASVNFFMDFDRERAEKGSFRFAAQQSTIGTSLLQQSGRNAEDLKSIVVISPDGCYIKSDACLLIAKDLEQPFPALGSIGALFPRVVRDVVYDFVSANRFVFGENTSCRIPEPEERERFL
jgi:predicted DCC family thiol-disulfide oxidoreductase YuxK